jgi:hypothetical protein
MAFKNEVGSSLAEVLGEGLLELPWMVLSECDSIHGVVLGVIFTLVSCGIFVILLGLVAVVSDAFSPGSFQGLGLK